MGAPVRRGRLRRRGDAERIGDITARTARGHSGTITHHHALGRDHRKWYDMERPELFADALRAVKARLDPKHVMNPGVLID